MSNTHTTGTESRGIRGNYAKLEALELTLIGILLAAIVVSVNVQVKGMSPLEMIFMLIVIEGALFLLWGSYLLYIRIARAGGRFVDLGIWIVAAFATASVTFWTWTVLDINRLIITKLFYRGDAPVQFAWSIVSKQHYKEWKDSLGSVQ